MANYRAITNGNWSSLAIWEDDSSGSWAASSVLPGVDDNVWANTYTVTIDQDIDVNWLTNHSTAPSSPGVSNGGIFYVDANVDRTITAENIYASNAITVLELTALNTTNTVTINAGRILGSFGSYPVVSYASGTVNVNGTIYGVSYVTYGFYQKSGGVTLNITGFLYTAVDSRATCVYITDIINNGEPMVINFNGIVNDNASGACTGIIIYTDCDTELNMNGIYNIAGNNVFRVFCTASFTGLIEGVIDLHISSRLCCIYNTAGISELRFKDMVISVGGNTGNVSPIYIEDETPVIFDKCNLEFRNGYAPWQWNKSNRIYFINSTNIFTMEDNFGNETYLYGQNTGQPDEADVRDGVLYGGSDEFEGTCVVPPAESVVANVPVDDTVGTYALSGDLISRLGKCATTEEVDSTVAAYNS